MSHARAGIAVLAVACALGAWAAPAALAAPAAVEAPGGRLNVPVRSLHELRFDRLVRQSWDVSCGAAALSTLLTYHLGRPVSEYAIATWILRGVDPRRVRARGGFSLLDLKRFSQALGLGAEGYGGMTLEDLRGLGEPAIVPIRLKGLDHFVVVRGFAADRVVIGDPAFGNLTVPERRFARIWKGGIAFVVRPQDARNGAGVLMADATDLRVPDLPNVARLLRGAGPAPLTRGHPAVP